MEGNAELRQEGWADGGAWAGVSSPRASLLPMLGVAALGPTLLVPCENPHFDVPLLETLDGVEDTVLEPVLDGCGSQQLEVGVRTD